MRNNATASLLILFALGLGVVACDDDDPVAGDDEEFAATLGPEGSVQTDATGSATFVLDDGVVSYTIDVDDITAVTAAHIHGPAGPGEDAGVIVGLFAGPVGGTGAVSGRLVTDDFVEADISATNVSLDSLLVLMRSGQSYVNVHTVENPAGEIRGQITVQ